MKPKKACYVYYIFDKKKKVPLTTAKYQVVVGIITLECFNLGCLFRHVSFFLVGWGLILNMLEKRYLSKYKSTLALKKHNTISNSTQKV